jgi:threonylcarbamoyladenosine tRNA methylthiotransferase MtaB
VSSFYIENFGCRATQADGAALERQFLDRGMGRARTVREAEIVVLNTCTVTAGADKDARAAIRRLQRENPACQILVTGCYAQRAPEELAVLPGVTWVVGNSHKHHAAEIIAAASLSQAPSAGFVPLHRLRGETTESEPLCPTGDCADNPQIVVGDIFAHTELLAAPVFEAANERTRPNLKVQDGCDNRCSFCVIPYVRGQSRSMAVERVIDEICSLVDAGYREVVISGINLGRWGRDLPVTVSSVVRSGGTAAAPSPHFPAMHHERPTTSDQRLVGLIRAILERTSLEKLRISSVEPMDWNDELIALVASSQRIAKHAHVPLQSASDAVLRRMHRKYRPWHYQEKILKIREAMPTAAIGADVMVGFPGESDAEFQETRQMIEELPFTYLHVFTYSARPGTPAAELSGQVPVPLARERNRELREIAAAKKRAFAKSLVGTIVEAITLQSRSGEFVEALTDNYLKMRVQGEVEANQWRRVLAERVEGGTLVGRVAAENGLCSVRQAGSAILEVTR